MDPFVPEVGSYISEARVGDYDEILQREIITAIDDTESLLREDIYPKPTDA